MRIPKCNLSGHVRLQLPEQIPIVVHHLHGKPVFEEDPYEEVETEQETVSVVSEERRPGRGEEAVLIGQEPGWAEPGRAR